MKRNCSINTEKGTITTDLMQDASEIVHYDNPKVPLYIQQSALSDYPDRRALCHWHEDIELVYILEGEMNYDVNGEKILLTPGDSIFINTRQMHHGYSSRRRDCTFLCILFHPSLLMSHPGTTRDYVMPILENTCIDYIFYPKETPYANHIESLQKQIFSIKNQQPDSFSLLVISCLFQLWDVIYRTCREQNLLSHEKQTSTDLLIQKKMVSYIYQNYGSALSLDDIASSGNVSRSKCCAVFKKYLQQSPIDFLNAYRLEVSRNLLKDTNEKIATIALACGFNHLSYYSKIFVKKYGCTPSVFRSGRQ